MSLVQAWVKPLTGVEVDPVSWTPEHLCSPRARVVAIDRNRWSRSVGMSEASNRSRVTDLAAGAGRDLFEAGLNEAASG